jgi:solute carrier family 26, other
VAKKCSIPIPIELIGVVSGTVISQLMDLKNVYNIKTIGAIPTGFPGKILEFPEPFLFNSCFSIPEPTIPEFGLFRELLVDSFTIGMVSYTVSVSMALIFAQKFSYEIDGNQELLAMVGFLSIP